MHVVYCAPLGIAPRDALTGMHACAGRMGVQGRRFGSRDVRLSPGNLHPLLSFGP